MKRSDAGQLHNYETDPVKRAALILGKNSQDFPDLSKIAYVPPPVVRNFKKKTSFVHN